MPGMCCPYRYYTAFMASLGLFTITSYRAVFVLVLTHTNRPNLGDFSDTSIFPNCSTRNTSRDYSSDFSDDTKYLFHTSFYIGCAGGLLFGGLASSWFPSNRVITASVIFTSFIILILPMLYSQGSGTTMLLLRLFQGLGEQCYQPALASLMSVWALNGDKSRIMSTSLIGSTVSPAVANIVTGITICFVSWDSSFYIYGVAGMLWAIAWVPTTYPLPSDCPYLSEEERKDYESKNRNVLVGSKDMAFSIPWKEILTSKPVWCIWLCSFNKLWVNATLAMLQPQFFRDIYGLRVADIGLLLSLQPLLNTTLMMLSSYLADRLVVSGILSMTNTRKTMQAFGGFLEGLCLILIALSSSCWQSAYALFLLAFAFGGVSYNGFKCNRIDLTSQFSNVLTGVNPGIMGGVMCTYVASLLPGQDASVHNWNIMFILGGSLSLICSSIFLVFASGKKQSWDTSGESNSEIEDTKESVNEKRGLVTDHMLD